MYLTIIITRGKEGKEGQKLKQWQRFSCLGSDRNLFW